LPLDANEFRAAVRGSRSHADRMKLIEDEVLDRDPFVFASDMELYSKIRRHLEMSLGAEPESVTLVGSGAVGFSIAPDNFTRPFLPTSDLDFAVVSPKLFDAAWAVLLRWGHPVRHHIPKEAQDWFSARSNEIFWGWLNPPHLRFEGATKPSLLNDLRHLKSNWFSTFKALGTDFPGTEVSGRETTARLYRSRMHLLQYQTSGLNRVWHQLNKEE
jgi:hypothetical protein